MAKIEVREHTLKLPSTNVDYDLGGANGIGKTAACMFHEYGAKVVIGDLATSAGEKLAAQLGERALFQTMDVDDWVSQRNLFDAAMQAFGSIDVVCANVAIPEKENWLFEDKLDADGRLAEPDLKLIDVNLKGVMRSCKLAMHYFRKNSIPGGAIVITGFAASSVPVFSEIRDSDTYESKHALLGLMRSLAVVGRPLGIRTNMVAPWLTG
ncbi:hypothetical protein H2198_009203 [Neophaeococcomyces mojaviensis]|uniref:Uncharacterized protein n=1 Tax=Neophaeococcomyces mojaviensis TaxID=3383035 RepID=A0ACC2ZVD3_9EURO|nr:hypothetical protein H2198_009203 [Knufia sp. JES_112]